MSGEEEEDALDELVVRKVRQWVRPCLHGTQGSDRLFPRTHWPRGGVPVPQVKNCQEAAVE